MLQWSWQGEQVTGDLVIPWDHWQSVQTPLYIGERPPKEGKLPEELPEGDTIVVDTGAKDASDAESALRDVPGAEGALEIEPETPEERPITEAEDAWLIEAYGEQSAYTTTEGPILVPKTVEEALGDPINGPYWKEAIGTEISKL